MERHGEPKYSPPAISGLADALSIRPMEAAAGLVNFVRLWGELFSAGLLKLRVHPWSLICDIGKVELRPKAAGLDRTKVESRSIVTQVMSN
jgi:hypothetical protein